MSTARQLLTKPTRIIDRKYRSQVMQNEGCVVYDAVDKPLRVNSSLHWAQPYGSLDWECEGTFEFHHVKPYGGGIIGSKVSDRRGVKVCQKHHIMAAERNRFEARFGIDLEAEIQRLNARYPPQVKKERAVSPKHQGIVKRRKMWAIVTQTGAVVNVYERKPSVLLPGNRVVRVEVRECK